jgi:hypothetical protein
MNFKLTIPALFTLLFIYGCDQHSTKQLRGSSEKDVDDKFLYTYLVEEDSLVYYGELIYVPVYSEVYYGDAGKTIELAITLSIHNTDLHHSITIKSVNYHNKNGNLINKLVQESVVLTPLETTNFMIGEKDRTGGTGANFIVEWNTDEVVSSPIIEAIMITTQMNQGISFTTAGKITKKFGRSTSAGD